MKSSAAKIQITGLDDLFGGIPAQVAADQIQELSLRELHPFKEHPFHVADDEKMREMAESVAQYGVLVPGIVRPRPEGGYEIIAGHRRSRASELAGKETMPVIVRDMDDDEATIVMVDSNLQREKILPSEKAFAYRMKLEAIKHQGQRTDFTSGPLGQKWSRDAVSANSPDSARQIQRLIRLTELVPCLLDLVDQDKFPLRPAVEVSYIPMDGQELLYNVIENKSFGPPSMEQAKKLRECSERTELTTSLIIDIISDEKPTPLQVTLKNKCLSQYFPKDYTQKQIEEVILSLLETWKYQQKGAVTDGSNS
ncbi:ParB/RepB/Spo0J family partition protein [Acutalibacter muris]|uniref:Chromosome partitioning protein ParB n=1 Tax=Acutalibacter muris TaxID=1796620 RepID=A0A1Z2XVQ0_9FIRM|nr:ParB/RepB/Spo0J family partition protein [Acutalibacter muris]ANU54241.1 chromosome partitioning protein ParB [Hungateiclostridiaceae bacterium KB18]ANU54409.1 chromosome partitioning protein ParB [Hungateiclostridiaceae bacterium KB18]ASB42369.1 chromosome partitioning protein ParB [Acutalibacter muris]ASB42538.1 chromosome partitioning protein ParB [Acutalibacter muris]QQR31654.1 ParB/RepB/Spo0J family partition protein [Acutalibacter muris]